MSFFLGGGLAILLLFHEENLFFLCIFFVYEYQNIEYSVKESRVLKNIKDYLLVITDILELSLFITISEIML